MRHRLANRVGRIPRTGMARFFKLATERSDLLSLGVGEPDFVTPKTILEAGVASLRRGETGYTATSGIFELRAAIARDLEARYGVAYDPEREIVLTVGVSEATAATLLTLVDPDDEVVVHQPGFFSIVPAVILAGGRPVVVATEPGNGFQVTADAIRSALGPRTRAVLLNYPNNPTGAVLERRVAAEIAEVLLRRDVILISDEIYNLLVYSREHVCLAAFEGMRERTVLLGGFSKSYAMTGWRLGYAAGPAELIEGIARVHQFLVGCPPVTAQHAALAALERGEDDVRRMRDEYDLRRRHLVDGLNRLGLHCCEPRGALYAFPSVAASGLDDLEFAEYLLEEERVFVTPGSAFGEAGAGFIRCCLTVPVEQLDEALARIARSLERLRGSRAPRRAAAGGTP